MKRLTKHVVYAVLILISLTHCDSASSSSDQSEPPNSEILIPIELVVSTNNSTVQYLEPGLVWEQIKGAKSYRLLLSESDTFETLVMDTTITGTSITTHPLTPETTYNWKMFPIKKNQSGRGQKFGVLPREPQIQTPIRKRPQSQHCFHRLTTRLIFRSIPTLNEKKYLGQATMSSSLLRTAHFHH